MGCKVVLCCQVLYLLVCSKHHICRPMSLSSRVGRVFSEASESLFGGSDFASEFGRGSEFVSISEPVQWTFRARTVYVSDVIKYPPLGI